MLQNLWAPARLNICTVDNMGVMICLGQGGLRSPSASSSKWNLHHVLREVSQIECPILTHVHMSTLWLCMILSTLWLCLHCACAWPPGLDLVMMQKKGRHYTCCSLSHLFISFYISYLSQSSLIIKQSLSRLIDGRKSYIWYFPCKIFSHQILNRPTCLK